MTTHSGTEIWIWEEVAYQKHGAVENTALHLLLAQLTCGDDEASKEVVVRRHADIDHALLLHYL